MTRERRVDAPSTRDAMIDELFSNFFDLIWRIAMVWRIAMAISGYDIGVRTTRQRVLETPCLTRHFQRKIPQNRRQRRQNFLLDKWCTSLLGPVQGVLCTLPSKKAALLEQDSGLRSQVSLHKNLSVLYYRKWPAVRLAFFATQLGDWKFKQICVAV